MIDYSCFKRFNNKMHFPSNMREAVYGDWGHIKPKACKKNKPESIILGINRSEVKELMKQFTDNPDE